MASPFEHYLYVLKCADGSLYTGYTTDVSARLATHQSGRGAKYTKSHAPVSLIVQARFYSKQRAMSAEALFKKLPRARKDALLAMAATEPFEDVLCRELPGFGEDSACEFVDRRLAGQVDPAYRDFMAKLIPTVDPKRMVGVRTPALRAIAKDLARRDDVQTFLRSLPHRLFEENQAHAFVIALERDYDKALKLYNRFLPYVDNWATCDQLSVKVLAKDPDCTLQQVDAWLASGHCYTIRFGIGVLMRLFLDERFELRFLDMVAAARMPVEGRDGAAAASAHTAGGALGTRDVPATDDDIYYVDMMRAWYFAEALAKQEAATLPYLERKGNDALLDEWTRRKAIQKAIESRRISSEMKERLRAIR